MEELFAAHRRLGVAVNCTDEDVRSLSHSLFSLTPAYPHLLSQLKRAFRKLALQHHPDRAKVSLSSSTCLVDTRLQVSTEACSRQFLEAQRAYEMISDYRKRRQLARDYAAKGPSPATPEMRQTAAASAAASRAPRVMSNFTAAIAAGAIVCAGVYMGTLKYRYMLLTTSRHTRLNGTRFAKKALERHLSGSGYIVKTDEAQVST
eukprot:765191-Hanusia_phi.AAC.6